MKRFLDLNGPSTTIVALAGLLLVAAPALLSSASLALGAAGIQVAAVAAAIRISVALGAATLGVLAILVVAEQVQDHLFDARYRKQLGRRIRSSRQRYECQYCGNRQVREYERACSVCGKTLE